ncbi:MAG: helix-turn-helix transcriptional regulator [Bacillota bacterium]
MNEQEYILEENSVYFIPPLTEHTIISINNMQYGYTVICLHNDSAAQYTNALLDKYVYKDKELAMRILDIGRRFNDTNDLQRLENEINQLLIKNVEIVCSFTKQMHNETVLSAVSFINEHLDEPFDLKKMSDHTYISKYHLIRLFKKKMGVAPYQFYIQEKIKKIRQGLLKGQPIVDLACNLNFSDQSHLCNTFKKHVGLTPIQFKKNYKEDSMSIQKLIFGECK